MFKRILLKIRKRVCIYLFSLFLVIYVVLNYQTQISVFHLPDIPNQIERKFFKPNSRNFIKSNQKITTKSNSNSTYPLIISKIVTDAKNSRNKYSDRIKYYAIDGNSFGMGSTMIDKCDDGFVVEYGSKIPEEQVDFVFFLDNPSSYAKEKYMMVYGMESEPHSVGGESWDNADFRMWYNLDLSFPGINIFAYILKYTKILIEEQTMFTRINH